MMALETHSQWEPVRIMNIIRSVRGLHNHSLSQQWVARKFQLITRAAPCIFQHTSSERLHEICAGETVGEGVVNGPRLLVGALEGRPTIASSPCLHVLSSRSIYCAGFDGVVDIGFVFPGAGGLAAVPKAGCHSLARDVELQPRGSGGEEDG